MSQPDVSLEELISKALQHCPHVAGRQLRFESHDGHVILRGAVPSYYHKQMAQETLRRLSGVRRIENQLEVSWS